MNKKCSHLIKFGRLGVTFTLLLFFLLTGLLQISCGSGSSDTIEAKVISDLPESIPAPIAKTEVDIGVDSTSFTITENSLGTTILSGEIFGDSEATVAMVVNGEFRKFVTTINKKFSIPIANEFISTDELNVGLSLVVLVSGNTEQTALLYGVSPPVVAKVFRDEKEGDDLFIQTAFTNTKGDLSDPTLAADFFADPPLLVENNIYFSGETEGLPTLYQKDLDQGGFQTILSQDFENIPILLRSQGPNLIRAVDSQTGVLQAINKDDGFNTFNNSGSNIPTPRWYCLSPDSLWLASTFKFVDRDSQFFILSRVDGVTLASTSLQVDSEADTDISGCEILNADTTNEVDMLVAKRFTNGTSELQLYEVTTLPPDAPEVQKIIPTSILTTSDIIREIQVESENREEALFIRGDSSGEKDIYLYNKNNNATSLLLDGNGFSIPRAIYTTGRNIVYEASTDDNDFADNKIFLFDRATNTSRFLTPGFMPSTSATNPGIVVHYLFDSQGNTQVGVYNLNN